MFAEKREKGLPVRGVAITLSRTPEKKAVKRMQGGRSRIKKDGSKAGRGVERQVREVQSRVYGHARST